MAPPAAADPEHPEPFVGFVLFVDNLWASPRHRPREIRFGSAQREFGG
jgi:hypothetical protein